MADPVYILFSDPYSLDQQISIYVDRMTAEYARDLSPWVDAEIRVYRSDLEDREVLLDGPVYLMVTREDDGLSIHGMYTSIADVHARMSEHFTESLCHCTIAWPGSALPIPMRA